MLNVGLKGDKVRLKVLGDCVVVMAMKVNMVNNNNLDTYLSFPLLVK